MRTIHHNAKIIPARYIPAYDEHIYEYGELSEEAKQTALDEWVDSGIPRGNFDQSLDEILDALDKFSGIAGIDWHIDDYYRVHLSRTVETYDWLSTIDDTGLWCSIDICEAWNRHVGNMIEYAAEMEDDEGVFSLDNETVLSLDKEIDAALADIEAVTNRNIDAEYDYYVYDPADAFKNACDSYGYEFEEDGTIRTDYLNCA